MTSPHRLTRAQRRARVAPYASGAPSYDAPIPAGAGTGRKIGKPSK
jgi:hypothetical protein